MFSETAEWYDLIYSFKNYEEEAERVAALLKEIRPQAKQLLDVACGTGEHARLLSSKYGYQVDGIDLDPALVRIAADKNPEGTFLQADMIDFELDRRYEVITCLFSSIGYVKSLANVEKSLLTFRRHLAEGGVVIVEPWFTPDAWHPGQGRMLTVEQGELKICRMSYSGREGRISRVQFEYLIGNEAGILRKSEQHELGLFTVEEMTRCFEAAGFDVDHDPEGLFGRGLYIGRMNP